MNRADHADHLSTEANKHWYAGFDWLRVSFIVFVLMMHLNVTQSMTSESEGITLWDIAYSQILCTAVPGFLFISVFLQSVKHNTSERSWKPLVDLCYLYVFWVMAWTLLTRSRPEPTVWGVITYALRGGGWAYYFFSLLLLVHALRIAIAQWSDRCLLCCFILAEFLISGVFWGMAHNGHTWMRTTTYWWPLSAVPIPFIAVLLARHSGRITVQTRLWFGVLLGAFSLTVMAAVWEWSLSAPSNMHTERLFLPEYLRLSPLLMVITLVLGVLKISHSPRIIGYVSRNSLGIFCLHVYILGAIYSLILKVFPHQITAEFMTILVLVFGLSFASEFIRKIFKSRIV